MKTGPVQTLTQTSSIFRIQQEKRKEEEKSEGGFVLFLTQVLWPPKLPQPKKRRGSPRFINSFIVGEVKLMDRLFFQLSGSCDSPGNNRIPGF